MDARREFLDSPLGVLALSARATIPLEAAGVSSVRELLRWSEPELRRLRTVSGVILSEIRARLSAHELALAMSVEDIRRWERFGE